MKKKVFITGGKGMLGSCIEAFYLKNGDKVLAPAHAELDILDYNRLQDAISSFKPDYVFHTAALHVNDCEENSELAFRLNTEASVNLARLCLKHNALLVYISSCGYFGDEIKYYSESDPVVLKTVYARTKYEGEQLSMQENKKTFAIRPGWLFGGRITHKKNFIYQRYQEAKVSSIIKSASDKYGCPTYTEDFVNKIEEVINTGQFGLYHLTNNGGCTRAQYVKKIIESCNLKTEVQAVDSSYFPRRANTPNCELLNNLNLIKLGLAPMPPWQDAIERYTKIMFKEIG